MLKKYYAVFLFSCFVQCGLSQTIIPTYQATVLEKRTDPAMQKWRDNRFGQFFHWGLYAVLGGEWKGKIKSMAAEWIMDQDKISRDDYAKLIHQFNPVHYNATKWAAMDKNMGVKYVVLTTKHHEGFCLWPSKYTDFDIASTPYKKDLIGPFVKAYTKAGIDVMLYYSILDWHNKDYRATIKSSADSLAFNRYIKYMGNQLKELLTLYPQIKGFWFDGQWDSAYISHPEYGWAMEKMLRRIKPAIIINNRIRSNTEGMRDHDRHGRHYGDYDASFERRILSDSTHAVASFDWEALMTIPENTWGYHKDWSIEGHIKTPRELVEMLVTCSSLGGNFLLNFGPGPDGSIRREELERSNSIGEWMKINGRAIYGAQGTPFPKPEFGYLTSQKVTATTQIVNACIFDLPNSRKIHLPFQTEKISNIRWLAHPSLKIIVHTLADGTAVFTIPAGDLSTIADVITFDLHA